MVTNSVVASSVERMLRPRSVAIVGVSSRPGSGGQVALDLLTRNGFAGYIHIVGRAGTVIGDRTCLASVDDLPNDIDLAILALPAGAVREAVEGCVRRRVGVAIIFASGFAELGQSERNEQEAVARIARAGGLALVGPNCLGFTNYVDAITIGFLPYGSLSQFDSDGGPAVAIISQSGGLMGHLQRVLEVRAVPVSAMISTGNEAGLQLADFVEYFIDDPFTGVISIYAEHIRDPSRFLAVVRRAQSRGKYIVMMHSGRSARAQEAARSHTGALASDYEVMRAITTRAGIALVETLEELVDVSEMLARFSPPRMGPAILTTSGAFCAIAHDFGETVSLDIPSLSAPAEDALRRRLPSFVAPRNPLDIATQAAQDPEIVRDAAASLLSDPGIGGLVAVIAMGNEAAALKRLNMLLAAREIHPKPLVLVLFGESMPEDPEFLRVARRNRIVLSTSAERALRAFARVTHLGRMLARTDEMESTHSEIKLPNMAPGPQAEWQGKLVLAAQGISVPAGWLARSADEAVDTAERIGFPVVMKAQAARLLHKTEAGGVILNVKTADEVRVAWQRLLDNLAHSQPTLSLDGILVEQMAPRGLELVVGGRRDQEWGPIVMVGLGGVWIETLKDIRLMPPDLSLAAISQELLLLRGAPLLTGMRGTAPVDLMAVAQAVVAVSRLMLATQDLVEVDVNPLIAYPQGQGAMALDALLVVAGDDV